MEAMLSGAIGWQLAVSWVLVVVILALGHQAVLEAGALWDDVKDWALLDALVPKSERPKGDALRREWELRRRAVMEQSIRYRKLALLRRVELH